MDKRSPVTWKLNSPRVLSLAPGRAIRFFEYHIFHTTSVNNGSCLSYGESKSTSGNSYRLHDVIPCIEIHKSERGIITEYLNVQVVVVHGRFIEHCYFFVFKIATVLIIYQFCVLIKIRHFAVTSSKSRLHHRISNAF